MKKNKKKRKEKKQPIYIDKTTEKIYYYTKKKKKKNKVMSLKESCEQYEKHVLNDNKFLSFKSFNDTKETELPNSEKVYQKFLKNVTLYEKK